MGVVSSIKEAGNSGHGMGLLYAGLIGLLLSDIVPTPADALYFNYQAKLKRQLEAKQITPKQYWLRDAAGYYLLNPIWWLLVLIIVSYIPGSVKKKMNIAIGIIAFGFVFAVINKNIKADEARELQKVKDEAAKQATTNK